MKRIIFSVALAAIPGVLFGGAAAAQEKTSVQANPSAASSSPTDLGSVARDKKKEETHRRRAVRVYSNEDLATHRDAERKRRDSTSHDEPNDEKLPKDAQEARARIHKQRAEVTRLQEHVQRLEQIESDRAQLKLEPRLTAETCAHEPERCETKRQAALDLVRSSEKLKSEQAKLDDWQESARKQGYPESVWDPE